MRQNPGPGRKGRPASPDPPPCSAESPMSRTSPPHWAARNRGYPPHGPTARSVPPSASPGADGSPVAPFDSLADNPSKKSGQIRCTHSRHTATH